MDPRGLLLPINDDYEPVASARSFALQSNPDVSGSIYERDPKKWFLQSHSPKEEKLRRAKQQENLRRHYMVITSRNGVTLAYQI